MKLHYIVFVATFLLANCSFTTAQTNEVDPKELAYHTATTAGAYDKIGRKNLKWDKDAKDCLTLYAHVRCLTNGIPDDILANLKAKLSRLDQLGCNDPLIRYLQLRFVFSETHSAAETDAAFSDVAAALQQSDYPEIIKCFAIIRWRDALKNSNHQEPAGRTLSERAAAYLAKAIDDKTMPLKDADDALDQLMSAAWWTDALCWNCYRILEPSLTNHWDGTSVALRTKGRAYLSYAWLARGTGYANAVSAEGWKLMEQRLEVATEALETAWKLNPTDARICLEMLRAGLAQGPGSGRMETWFQRGMKLNPGYWDLCYAKLEYLRPRWYGSIGEMIDFGRECSANTNWTGRVRLLLVDAHLEASREIQDDSERKAYWKKPNVWPDIESTYEQFFKLYPNESGYRQNYALFAARCGKIREFATQIKMAPWTNYSMFGGEEKLRGMINYAQEHQKDN